MSMQHIENMLRRYRGQVVNIKTMSGGVYEGSVTEITNDYVALSMKLDGGEPETVYVLLQSIEAVLPRSTL
jgi:ferredoxin-fold anticodon binding domain-containing protein